jgi:predicted Zn-dependent protease
MLVGRIDEAIVAFKKALTYEPDVKRFLLSLTRAYIADGSEQEARRTFQRYAARSDIDENGYEDFRNMTILSLSEPGGSR